MSDQLSQLRSQSLKDFVSSEYLNLPTLQKNLIDVNEKTAIEDVLALLARHNILSIPVYSSIKKEKEYIAIVNVFDMLDYILFAACDELEVGKLSYSSFKLKHPISDLLLDTGKESSKLWCYEDVSMDKIFEVLSKGVHRCLVKYENRFLLLTQFDIVKAIYNSLKVSSLLPDEFLEKNMRELGLFPSKSFGKEKEFMSVGRSISALTAFKRMVINEVSGLPIVNNKGQLHGVLTTSDLRGIEVLTLNDLLLSCEEFIKKRKGGHFSVLTIHPETTLRDVIVKFIDGRVHHLWFVDSNQKPVGVLTLTDLMSKFSSYDYYA